MRRAGTILTAVAVWAGGCAAPFTNPTSDPAETIAVRGAPPADEADHLAKAAACLDRGDEPAALPHLAAHVRARPDAVMIRAYLAELLLKLGKLDEARGHFERYTRDAAGMGGKPGEHLVHCHTRLMEIAQQQDDPYREKLHRGIGLVLLVRQWEAEPTPPDPVQVEQTLAKAAAELREAKREKRADPRADVYAAEVWSRLGQPSAARAAARRAVAQMPDAALTTAEVEQAKRLAE